MNTRLRFFFRAVLIAFLSFASSSQAATDRFSVITDYPTTGEFDYARTLGSDALPGGDWRFFTAAEYARHPLEITVGGARQSGIVDDLFVQYFGAAYGLADVAEIEAILPAIWFNSYDDPRLAATGTSNQMGLGDLLLRTRIEIVPADTHCLGFALVPFLTLPTGNENHYVSDARPTGGFKAVLDRDFGGRVSAAINAGITGRGHVVLRDLDTDALLTLAAAVKVWPTSRWSVGADLLSRAKLTSPYGNKTASPAEAALQMTYDIGKRFNVNAGGSMSVVRGAGAPLYRGFAGLTFTP